jgi:hypothetical protein
MLRLLMFSSLICPPTNIQNYTKGWNDKDLYTYKNSIDICQSRYELKTCVKTFRKVEENVYSVICGLPK